MPVVLPFAESCDGNSRAFLSSVISSYNIADECAECTYLLCKYEAATFEQAKIHNALDIAEYLQDRLSTRLIKLEAYEVTARRGSACSALVRHQRLAHRCVNMMGMGSPTVAIEKGA